MLIRGGVERSLTAEQVVAAIRRLRGNRPETIGAVGTWWGAVTNFDAASRDTVQVAAPEERAGGLRPPRVLVRVHTY